ncbi:MAG: type II toxin-antitoxin system PemK/MazF family toxin [Chitinophagaceae bacterium]
MAKADIILIPFPFTNLTDTKIRPCLVLIEAEYDVTVSFITTQTGWNDNATALIRPTDSNGLKKESLIRLNKLATIDKELIIGKIGELDATERDIVNQKLKELFQL